MASVEGVEEPPRSPRQPAVLVRAGHKRVRVSSAPVESPKRWPTKTDTWCWHCCHPFDTPPLPLPFKYDDRRDVFHVMGTFCSWACMKTFNSESSSYMKSVTANVITLFKKRCTGELSGIRAAPPRLLLAAFGGTMGIEEFRGAAEAGRHITVLPPRMIIHEHALHEHKASVAAHNLAVAARPPPNLQTTVDFKAVSAKNETLRLKRPKPLKNNRNLLEQAMGIVPA